MKGNKISTKIMRFNFISGYSGHFPDVSPTHLKIGNHICRDLQTVISDFQMGWQNVGKTSRIPRYEVEAHYFCVFHMPIKGTLFWLILLLNRNFYSVAVFCKIINLLRSAHSAVTLVLSENKNTVLSCCLKSWSFRYYLESDPMMWFHIPLDSRSQKLF